MSHQILELDEREIERIVNRLLEYCNKELGPRAPRFSFRDTGLMVPTFQPIDNLSRSYLTTEVLHGFHEKDHA